MTPVKRSWDLKVDRAEKHLKELKSKMRTYAAKHPYRAVRARQPKGQRDIWVYTLEMTKEPDPKMAVIVGDCLYNLRSALDHLAVGMAPNSRRSKAAFPVEFTDPWETDASGSFVYPDERRESFRTKVRGMPDEVVAMIKVAQPYQRTPDELKIDALALISRLENADKHRQLITLGYGVEDVHTIVTARDDILEQHALGFRESGAEVAKFGFSGRRPPPESEVKVQISGTASVAIKIADVDGNFGMPQSLEILIGWVRNSAIPEFTPYVRADT